MKVAGQLENAGFEQLVADPAVSPTGRAYANIAAPAAAVIKYYDGTAWRTLQTTAASTLFSQNSGLAVTVDWSRGLNQQVVLTNHCLISFTNPQAGQLHRLVVVQKTYASATPKLVYQYKLNMADQDPQRNSYQPQGALPQNENQVYTWYYTAGIRTGYATVPAAMASPFSNIAALASGLDISPDGKSLAYGRAASPFLASQLIFDAGQRMVLMGVNPNGAPGAGAAQFIQVRYSPYQDVLFAVTATTPFIQAYSVQNSTPQGVTIFANPVTLPAGAGASLAVHPTGNYVVCGHATSPFMSAYNYDQAGFGAKIANPASLPAAQINALDWSPTGDYIAVASATTPFIQAWPFDPSAGSFGVVIANPSSLPLAGVGAMLGKCLAWRPQGDFIAMGDGASVYVTGFNRSTGVFTTQQSGATGGTTVQSLAWTPDGQYLIVGTSTAPFLKVYDFSASTLVNVTFDGASPAAQVNDVVIDKTGRYVVLALNAAPWMMVYPLPTKIRNYLRV